MSAEAEKVQNPPYHIEALSRAFGILELLSDDESGLTLGDLVKRTALHKSTVHRFLKAMEHHGYVERKPQDGTYILGLKLFALGSKALAQLDLHERAKPHLQRLVYETGETAHLCVLDEDEILYLEKVEATRTVRIPSTVGRRYPAHCGASGKAILAYMPEERIDDVIRTKGMTAYTKNTITTPAELKKALRLVQEQGYAFDDEEFEEGLKCLAAPVRNHAGQVIASIGIAGLAFRLTDDKIAALADSVMDTAQALSVELGLT